MFGGDAEGPLSFSIPRRSILKAARRVANLSVLSLPPQSPTVQPGVAVVSLSPPTPTRLRVQILPLPRDCVSRCARSRDWRPSSSCSAAAPTTMCRVRGTRRTGRQAGKERVVGDRGRGQRDGVAGGCLWWLRQTGVCYMVGSRASTSRSGAGQNHAAVEQPWIAPISNADAQKDGAHAWKPEKRWPASLLHAQR